MNQDTLTAQSLLNCLVREVSGPEEQVREADGQLIVRLARSDRLLRLGTRRRSAGPGPRLTGDAAIRRGDSWQPVGWAELTPLIAAELTLATGVANDEFAAQVRGSHASIAAILRARGTGTAGHEAGQDAAAAAEPRVARYLASEQALVAGHRFHPAPKARSAEPGRLAALRPRGGGPLPAALPRGAGRRARRRRRHLGRRRPRRPGGA